MVSAPEHAGRHRAVATGFALMALAMTGGTVVTAAAPPKRDTPKIMTGSIPAAAVGVPAAPEDPTAAKAYAVLSRACASCHQSGRLKGARPARGLGNILDLGAIAADSELVRPGLPDASRLYTLMQMRQAPHDFSAEELTAADLDAVRSWIEAVAPVPVCERTPIKREAVAAAIFKRLSEVPPERIAQQRFLTLTHLHNACVPERELKIHAEALGRMVNGLSFGAEPVALEAIDPARTVFRVDLGRIGWDEARWARLAAFYPYQASDGLGPLLPSTSAPSLVVRGDWFVATAGRAPLYYELLDLPDRLATLQQTLKLEPEGAATPARTRRLGVGESRLVRGSRLLQRQTFANGAAWTTFDYAATPGRPDLFDVPAGPAARNAPRPDSSLVAFNLPNGFQAFFMANGEGVRMNEAPLSVMRDEAGAGGRVTAGAGCLACHDGSVPAAVDELRPRLQADTSLARELKERLLAMHGTSAEVQRLFEEDAARLQKALVAAGLTPGANLDGSDPVSVLIRRYERAIGPAELAAETGLDVAHVMAAARRSGAGPAGDVIARMLHGPVPRREVMAQSAALVAALTSETAPAAPAAASPMPATRWEGPELVMKTERDIYKSGDTFSVTVRSREACYLTLINVDRTGRGTVVYPNDFEPNNALEPGRDLRVPADGAPYLFRLREPGRETVIGICHGTQRAPFGIRHDFERQRFTELGNYRAFLNRSVLVDIDDKAKAAQARPAERTRRGRAGASPAPSIAGRPDYQVRTAVQILVEP